MNQTFGFLMANTRASGEVEGERLAKSVAGSGSSTTAASLAYVLLSSGDARTQPHGDSAASGTQDD